MFKPGILNPKFILSRLQKFSDIAQNHGVMYAFSRVFRKLYIKLTNEPPIADVGALITAPPPEDPYHNWIRRNFARESDQILMAETVEVFNYKPLVSVLMPVYNTSEDYLRSAIESVKKQAYPYWELCIVDDASTVSHVKNVLQEYSKIDSRIKVIFREKTENICAAYNAALGIANGEFIALLRSKDNLSPDALYQVVVKLHQYKNADFLYSDEDKLNDRLEYIQPIFKPEWQPGAFLFWMYSCHLGVYRRSLVNTLGGFRIGYEENPEYDLILRLAEKTNNIIHINKVLYHVRECLTADNAPANIEINPQIHQEIINFNAYESWVLENCVDLNKLDEIAVTLKVFKDKPIFSIIITVCNTAEAYLRHSIDSVIYQIYPHWELYIVDNGSIETITKNVLQEYTTVDSRIKIISLPDINPIGAALNSALAIATGDFVTVLGNKDVLATDALYQIALQINKTPEADVIYSDENQIDDSGIFSKPFFKPEWHKDSFIFWMKSCHLGIYRRSLVNNLGGFTVNNSIDAEYDLILRLSQITKNIFHVAKILYYTRKLSQTETHQAYPYQLAAKSVADVLHNKGEKALITGAIKFLETYQVASNNDIDNLYEKWLKINFPKFRDFRQMAATVPIFTYKPLISLIMPVFNTPDRYLREGIESVINQIYPNWELCIADDASTEAYIKPILQEYANKDSRIKLVFRSENGHISAASNSAIEIATGEFISFLDHDDLLSLDALYQVVLLLNQHPEADMIYSDADKINENNQILEPCFKPDWCPDSFLSRMYSGHLGTYRRSIINAIGGFREGYEGSQDYDLVLRFTEKTSHIFHIPKILYHWRMHPESTASGNEVKLYAYDAAQKALSDAIERRGEKAQVFGIPGYFGHYNIRYEISNYQLVSIIIPTRNLGNILDNCLTSIFTKTIYPNYEVIVIDNGSDEAETAAVISKWLEKESTRFKCYPLDIPFNYSKINNYAVTKAQGDYLLFLNNDTEIISPDWINGMVEQAQRLSIGAVGALLLYPDNTIQHAGVILGLGGVAAHSHRNFPANAPGYVGHIISISNVSAVTGACLMCRREVFVEIGGFNEELSVAYNDVDLCLKMLDKGYHNIYLPHVQLYHYESKSRGYEDTQEKQERLWAEAKILKNRWQKLIDNDPCYSPHLTRDKEDYSIKI